MQNTTETKDDIANMPHSVSPDSTAADGSSATISQGDNVKSEPETQDIAMGEEPMPTETEKPKVSLEELFDDEDSDDEFPSSAPAVKYEEESSQPAPLCVQFRELSTAYTMADNVTAKSLPNLPSPTPR
jgi:hypothetical protein